jgi:phage terminase large subunit-like protein
MELIAMLPPEEQAAALEGIDPDALLWDWNVWARPEQLPPTDDWNVWLVLAGRGFGKTRMASEWVRETAKYTTEGQRRFALVARTAADVRDVIVEGESGIINISPPSEKPHYEPSKRRLTWPNGNTATLFTADEPDGLRGPQFRLDIATPVPTPTGWSTMGDLQVGDVVFDELGSPCNVTAVHEIELALDSYRLNFSNGTHIDADGKHRWKVLTNTDLRYVTTHFDGVIPETWATDRFGRESTNHQVKDTNQLRANTKRRLYIPATKAVEYVVSTEPLPIDPWVLGLVLGDGASAAPSYIATHTDDKSWLLEELGRSGLASRDMNKDHVWAADLIAPWRELGLYNNKHVPEIYLRASAEDRLSLLQGLTDSDGGVEPNGAFRFYNTNKVLIDGYIELARSLGLVPKVYYRKPRERAGVYSKEAWYVQVNSTFPLVRNPRKLAKAKYEWKYQSTQHSIVSIDPTTPKFMRCITVDSASHLYLAGEGLIPTSNSHAWGDEVAAWRQTPDAAGMTAFDNLRVGTRLGKNPQILATTTPKRTPLLYKLIEESRTDRATAAKVVVTKGSTMDNAGNLSGAYLETIMGVYEGTSLARQELYGEMLDDLEGAMWNEELVEAARHTNYPASTPLRVIGVDPSVAENPRDECGIVVCASTAEHDLYKRHAWVLEDASIHGSPDTWARKVVEMARKWGCPVVAEVNQGGALVRNAINSIDPSVKVLEVHSKYGKQLRAEPILLAYEQGRVHHVNYLPELESQMYSWIPGEGKSPDRIDAMVHAMTALLIKPPPGFSGGKLRAKSLADRKMGVARPNTGNVGRVFRVR